jgi:hypothetical protein
MRLKDGTWDGVRVQEHRSVRIELFDTKMAKWCTGAFHQGKVYKFQHVTAF